MPDPDLSSVETDFTIGQGALAAYSRLSYTMWHALAEFIDNSTQSRLNYGSIIDLVLAQEQQPLRVTITHDRINKTITIEDNSIGMTRDDLIAGLKIATPTQDSKGRSKYGMGMKTAACWIGRQWNVVTCEWDSGIEWTAEIDVNAIATTGKKVLLTPREVDKSCHYTKIVISDLHRTIQKRTEETIRSYLGSMYRFDLGDETLQLVYNNDPIPKPDDYEFDTDPEGQPMRQDIPRQTINGKMISGWFGVLKTGGRKYGGFSLFQERRQIQGWPNAWKPRSIYGGVDDEGANNLISQRLIGMLQLENFHVSHTKDTILFEDDEEHTIEELLKNLTKDYREYATKRRNSPGTPWAKEKVKELVEGLAKEFISPEMKDAINTATLPPLETIQKNNRNQMQSLVPEEALTTMNIMADLRIVVSMQEKSEYEPHLTITAGADVGTIHVIINGLHPYFCNLDSTEAINECIRQYIHDAISEYRVARQIQPVTPDCVRRMKDVLLRAPVQNIENNAVASQTGATTPEVLPPG